jgi:DNA-binding transcriptional ArsR family regulator
MTTIRLTPDDLAKLRFAYRPLLEIPMSYRVLINPEFHAPHRRWVEEAHRALYDLELPFLDALVSKRQGYIPDFLTPTPDTSQSNIEDDLALLLATPNELIRKNVQALIAHDCDTDIRRFYIAHPREAVQRLVEDLRLYWRRVLEPSWSQMVSILEGDLLYRGRLLAMDGPDSLLPDLHDSITYQHSQIHVGSVCNHKVCPEHVALAGDGLRLVPAIFISAGRALQVTPEWHPMIIYNARGVGLYARQTRASKPLELALGAGRARVLQGLRTPTTTGEMAHRLSLTSGAISQQLDRLKRAGLVEAHRSGKRVYYQLTRRGEELIALFERMN